MIKIIFFSIILIQTVVLPTLAQEFPEMIRVEKGDMFETGDNLPVWLAERKFTVGTFYISKTPVTVLQYKTYCLATGKSMPIAPDWGWIDEHPMVNISWHEAYFYILWLEVVFEKPYDFPSARQWEYAAAGGKKSQRSHFSGSNNVDEVAWYSGESKLTSTYPVAQKKPNELGLYDMSGNVWEWTSEFNWYDYNEDPEQWPYLDRFIFGGSWQDSEESCIVDDWELGYPLIGNPNIGFRVVINPESED